MVFDGGAERDELPIRILSINIPRTLGTELRTVGYFFAVNGTYRHQRDEVRLLQNNMHDRYSYFSKVEVYFPYSGKSDPKAAMEKFLRVLVPVLYQEHWPDWDEATRDE